ncbi:MAG: DUF4123 domain-containing protein [Pseudomonadota bacterium]
MNEDKTKTLSGEEQAAEPASRDRQVKIIAAFLQARAGRRGGGLHAILDAAASPEVLSGVFRFGRRDNSLFRGLPEEPLADAAPYLMDFSAAEEGLNWFIDQGSGKAWGVFLVSKSSPDEIIDHFGRFISVRDENDAEMYFRFYDPRVLRVFLPTLTKSEARAFFGPVAAFMIETPDSGVIEYCLGEQGLEAARLSPDQGFSEPVSIPFSSCPGEDRPPQPGAWVIRDDQITAFSERLRRDFEDRLAALLGVAHPDKAGGLSREESSGFAARAVAQAAKYGITEEREAAMFAEFVLELGEDFNKNKKNDWIEELLKDPDLDGRAKVQLIRKGLAERDAQPPETSFALARAAAGRY